MSEELDLVEDFRTIETFFKNAADAELADETWSLEPLRAEQALARLRTSLAIRDKALVNCESTLQLCSERIASDRVTIDKIADAMVKFGGGNAVALKQSRIQMDATDRYVFAAIDAARRDATQALSPNTTDAK